MAKIAPVAPVTPGGVVLAFRVELYRAAGRWEAMGAVARHLAGLDPGEPKWVLDMAWSARWATGVADAKAILQEAEGRFPDCGTLHYNLACYACVEGDLPTARERLRRAFRLEPNLNLTATDDPDLEPLFGPENPRP